MSYYETLKPETEKVVGKLFASVKTLAEQVRRITKRLADEKNNSVRLAERIKELKSLAGESLSGDQNTYEKYRTNLKKLSVDLEMSDSMIKSLSEEILPGKKRELNTARTNLTNTLTAYLLKSRPIADAQINKLLRECICIRQDFLDSFTKIFADCGLVFIDSDSMYCPGPWSGEQVRDLCIDLGIGISRAGTISMPTAAVEPQTTPEDTVTASEVVPAPEVPHNEPVLTQTPAEGSLIPSEVVLQAPEPQTPPGKAVETTPGMTLLT
jgi:hypothetical protein